MAKNLFDVVQALFLLAALYAALFSCIARVKSAPVRKWSLWAALIVFVLSLVLAFLRDTRIIKYNQINNIYLLVISLVAGTAFIVLLWVCSCKKDAAAPLEAVLCGVGVAFTGALLWYRFPTVAAMPFHFVGRDDTYFSTYFLTRLTGFVLALLVLALVLVSLYKALSRSPGTLRAAVSTAMYAINAFVSFVAIVGIINSYYRRKFPLPTGLRKSLPALIRAEDILLFVALAVLAAFAVWFVVYNARIHGSYDNPAQHRKLRAMARNNRRWGVFLLALLAFVWVDLTAIKKASNKLVELSPSEEYEIDGDEIFIPLAQVSDGHLHRFTWTNDKGKAIRFIIVQKQGTSFGIGFDACEICGNVGYYERKNEVVCNRCDVVMNKSTIGLKGGCNPIPLDSRMERGGIVISTQDLDKEAGRF